MLTKTTRFGSFGLLAVAAVAASTWLVAGCTPDESESPLATTDTESAGTLDTTLPAAIGDAEALVTAELLRTHVAALADDAMAGRAPGTEGDRMAQHYLIREMQGIGLEPAGPGGEWLQPFDIVGITAEVPKTWSFATKNGEMTMVRNDEFVVFSGSQSDRAAIENAELVFVGYGIEAPEYGWDDFGDADLSGKVLVMMNNDPDWDDDLFAGDRRLFYGRWVYKYESAARQGAVGAIVIHTTPSAGYPWQVVTSSWTGEQVELPAGQEPRLAIGAWTTEDATRRLFKQAGFDLDTLREEARSADFSPVPLGITTSLAIENSINRTETANVLGLLPASDADLSDQYVVYSAHYDHLGNSGEGSDSIYNGALDNAAGTSTVLAIARAMAALPERPRRSTIFAFVGAEESGLLGSRFYAENPTVPPGRMVANLNFDGGNIWGRTEDVTFIGYGKSSLDAVVEAFAAQQGRTVQGDQFPDRGFFYRSDQFNFAKIGVPAIYLDTGTRFRDRDENWGREQIEAWEAQHYHQPSDELVDSWNWEGMVEDTVLGLRAGVWIANQESQPTWNPGDEFEAARQEALAAIQ